jgi:hypothetical protein
MMKSRSIIGAMAAAVFAMVLSVSFVFGQAAAKPQYKTQEFSEADGIPVLIKHLPDWENLRSQTTFAKTTAELKSVLGDRPILDLIDFTAGTEAVSAPYPAGKLLIIEFSTPQASVEADGRFTARLSDGDNATTAYRRIGNYNVLVLDAADQSAAVALIDQVKYEKNIQWLGENPFLLHRAERAFVITTSDIFLSTLIVILMGIGVSILTGLVVGLVFFQLRERRRAGYNTYTDAGGMTRLNLDGFTPDIVPDRLLGK